MWTLALFLLRIYRYILLCFYYVATDTYCGGLEFKYRSVGCPLLQGVCALGWVKCREHISLLVILCMWQIKKKSSSSALLCCKYALHLNLPNSVNKCKTDIKTYLLMQPCHFNFLICRFELLCRTVINFSPPKYVFVLRELPNKLIVYENPLIRGCICAMLTFKSISYQISQFFILFWSRNMIFFK